MILLHLNNHKNALKLLNIFCVFDKYNIAVLLTLGKSLVWTLIFNLNKTPLEETGCLSNFLGSLSMSPALHPGKVSTSSELYPDYFRYFALCSGIQFFYLPPFLTQSVRLPLVTYLSLCSTYVTYRTPCHAIGHQVLPTQPLPREAEDFPRGDKYFKHVPLPTYLIYFSPKRYT